MSVPWVQKGELETGEPYLQVQSQELQEAPMAVQLRGWWGRQREVAQMAKWWMLAALVLALLELLPRGMRECLLASDQETLALVA